MNIAYWFNCVTFLEINFLNTDMCKSQSNPECGQQSADPSEACSNPGFFNGGVLQRSRKTRLVRKKYSGQWKHQKDFCQPVIIKLHWPHRLASRNLMLLVLIAILVPFFFYYFIFRRTWHCTFVLNACCAMCRFLIQKAKINSHFRYCICFSLILWEIVSTIIYSSHWCC